MCTVDAYTFVRDWNMQWNTTFNSVKFVFVGCVRAWYYLKRTVFPHFHKQQLPYFVFFFHWRSSIHSSLDSMTFLRIPSSHSYLLLSYGFLWFCSFFLSLFSIDFCTFSCSYNVCTLRTYVSWLLCIYLMNQKKPLKKATERENEREIDEVTSICSKIRSSADYIMCWWILEDWQKASTIRYTKMYFEWNE